MKSSGIFITTLLLSFLLGCSNKNETKETKEIKIEVSEKNSTDGVSKNVASFEIEGMTCAVGCAGKIKNTLVAMDGVISCDVNFDEKKANIEFDDAKISEKEMISTIEKLHDGQYKITKVQIEKTVIKNENHSDNNLNKDSENEINRKETTAINPGKFLQFPNVFAALARLYKY